MSTAIKILVTGSGGQLGKELQRLEDKYNKFEFLFLNKEELSITDEQQISTILKEFKPTFLINCAAYTAVDKAESDREIAFSINGTSVGILAKHCRENDTRLIHISTDYVFDGDATSPMNVNQPVNPLNVYGQSKLLGEQLAIKENPEVIIVRTSWVYSSFGSNFVKTMLRLMSEREQLNVVNDQYGSPTYAADLAEALIKIINNGNWTPGIYHYSNTGNISWFVFAKEIQSLIQTKCVVNPISSDQFPTPAKRPKYSVLDTSKLTETFGIPMKHWKTSLAVCINKLIVEK